MTDQKLLQQVHSLAEAARCLGVAQAKGDEPAISHWNAKVDAICAQLAQPEQHPDDAAVDQFAAAMKAKMAKQRAKGYSGWDDKASCPTERLQKMLAEHVVKGDPVDVANFAMMLAERGESTAQPKQVLPAID